MGTFTIVALVFGSALKSSSPFMIAIEEFKQLVKPEIANALRVLSGERGDVEANLLQLFQSIDAAT